MKNSIGGICPLSQPGCPFLDRLWLSGRWRRQALGWSRAVNRTAENPVEAFVILDDLTLPIPVDAVTHVSDIEPSEIDEMMARGLVPEWPADAARLYPDLFKDRKAADYRYRRDGRVPAMFAAAWANSPR
jgi:hypothetical protein